MTRTASPGLKRGSATPLGRLHLAGRQPAHVVMPSFDHATHSETGACASCNGWQTMSTSVGSAEDSAFFSTAPSSDGRVTLQLLTPKAAATLAWSVTPKSTEK